MDAINALPIETPVAPMQRPRAETASEHNSQGTSFESLLHEKDAHADEQASVAIEAHRRDEITKCSGKDDLPSTELSALIAMLPTLPAQAPQPTGPAGVEKEVLQTDESAKRAGTDGLPGTEESSILVAMFPILPMPISQSAASPPASTSEISLDGTQAVSVAQTPLAPPLPLPSTSAVAMPAEPPLTSERGPVMAEPRGQTNSGTPASDSNAKVAAAIEVPPVPPSVMVSIPSESALPPEPNAKAASAPRPDSTTRDGAKPAATENGPVSSDGISPAMQEIAMTSPAKSRAPALKATANRADSRAPEFAAIPISREGDVRISPSTWQQNAGGGHRDENHGLPPESNDSTAHVSTVTSSFGAPAAPADEPAAIVRTQVETIVHRTVELAERLRATSGERLEVQIKLDAGKELTVRLQITHGEVRPIFLTDSHELRVALEQNWAQFSERSADRNLRISNPVFESPGSQSGMNNLNQQQREGRQRAFAEAQEAAVTANVPLGRKLPRRANALLPPSAPATGVQLYA